MFAQKQNKHIQYLFIKQLIKQSPVMAVNRVNIRWYHLAFPMFTLKQWDFIHYNITLRKATRLPD